MSKNLSRRRFLQMTGAVASVGLLAACAPVAQQSGGQAAGGAAAETIKMKWDTFRGPGTGWNEERIKTFKENTRMSRSNSARSQAPASRTIMARCMRSLPPAIWATSAPLTLRTFTSGGPSTGTLSAPIDDLMAADNTGCQTVV